MQFLYSATVPVDFQLNPWEGRNLSSSMTILPGTQRDNNTAKEDGNRPKGNHR